MPEMTGNRNYEAALNRWSALHAGAFWQGGNNDVPNTLAMAQLEATLGLAYEQRTASLIALWQMDEESAVAFNTVNDFDASAWTAVPRQIAARLGLKEARSV